jgi:hypothetical protein
MKMLDDEAKDVQHINKAISDLKMITKILGHPATFQDLQKYRQI